MRNNCLHIDYTFYNHNNNINKTMKEICTNCLHNNNNKQNYERDMRNLIVYT